MELEALLSRAAEPEVLGAITATALNGAMLWVVAYAPPIPPAERRRLLLALGVMHAALFAVLGWRLTLNPEVSVALALLGCLCAFAFARIIRYCHSCSRPANVFGGWRRVLHPDLPDACELCGAPLSERRA